MTIIQAAKYLEQIALSSPYIRTTKEGSVYDIMNTNGKIKYGVFVLSQTQHRQDDLFDYIGFNAFVIDRLDDDLESNRLQIQSTAKEVLANIVLTFKNRFYGSTFEQLVFHPFTEKFTDLCAGVYCQLNIKVPRALICEDSYGEIVHSDNLIPLTVTITENGVKEYKPETFDAEGFENVTIRVNVDNSGSYSSGYTSGYTDGYVSGTTDGYSSGKTDGIEEQKAKLISTSITENGTYQREDGYSSITVNVPSGESINNQTKSISITDNGTSAITYDNGFTGLETVNIEVNVAQTGYTQEDLDNAYASGVTSGVTEQKAKLISTSITENGLYEREDGFSSIEVNIPIQDYWNSGYTSGYTDGYTSGYTNGYQSGHTDGYNSGYTNGYQSGHTDGYDSGYTVGYASGYTDGYESGKTYSNGILNIVFDSNNLEGLVNNAAVVVTYSGISTTYIYTGETISISVLAGVNYNITFIDVAGYIKPDNYSFISQFKGNQTINAYFVYHNPSLDYENMYLTFTAISGGSIYWKANNNPEYTKTIQYSIDNGTTWNSVTSSSQNSGTLITTVEIGDSVMFKGNNSTYSDGNYASTFLTDAEISIYGNVMSLIYGDNFSGQTVLSSTNTFSSLFGNCTGLVDAYCLVLPATTLTQSCYNGMFNGCKNLKYGIQTLPATALTQSCYSGMFEGCTSLTTAPVLTATTLADSCYNRMFVNCRSLVTAPALPATTLAILCYAYMFYGCSKLNYVKCLATDVSANSCTSGWLVSVRETGTFVKASSMTGWPTGSSGIPNGWTVLEE